jgi:serine/threonine protein phosphatase 1
MSTFVIGDVHGCYVALLSLLDEVKPTATDRVIFLGDYIDRGPSSKSVIDWLIQFKANIPCVFLRGNHEVMILAARGNRITAESWRSSGGAAALKSYGTRFGPGWESAIPESHWKFFEQTTKWFKTENHIFVHGALDAELDLEEQPDSILFWERFDTIRPHKSGKKVICGHTPDPTGAIRDVGFALCIDTGPAIGGWLTCLNADTHQIWQANEYGSVKSQQLKVS